MENEKYGIELVADTSQFKESIREISRMVKALSKQMQKINHIPLKLGVFNNHDNRMSDTRKASNNEVFEETKRYTQLTRLIDRAQNSVSKYNARINQLKKDMEDLSAESENVFEQAQLLKELDLKADSGEAFTPAEGVMYSQLNREKIEKDEQKYYDLMEKNEQKLVELTQRRIIAEQQLEALKEKREKEASSGTTEEEVKKLQLELDKLKNKYNDVRKSANNSTKDLGSIFDKSIGKIKRFTFYLLGARSIFSLFMKYQSIYYQYNEQMQYQSELSQNAIALSLAPAFEFLGNVMTYASIAFAKFIELLTGVNVLSKVTTKGIREYNKSLKETQTLVSGIDEITNLTNPQNLGLASQYQALEDFQKKVAEVEKFFQENKWVGQLAEDLKKIWQGFSKIYDYIKDHWDVFKYIIGGAVIASLLGGNNILFKISVLGMGAFLGLIDAIKDYNDAKEKYDKNHQSTHDLILKNFKEYPKSLDDTKERLKGVKKGSEEWDKQIQDVKTHLASNLQEIINGELSYEEYKPVLDEIIRKMDEIDHEALSPEINFMMKLTGSKEDLELIRAYYATGSPNVKVSSGGGGNGGFGGGTSGGRSDVSSTPTVKKEESKSFLGKAWDWLNEQANSVMDFYRKATGHAKGLDYVPYDNYPALLHKGEAVVPAKYNPSIHGGGNDYTNELLETLIGKVDDLANRPNEFNIDGKDLARTMYPLLQTENQNYKYTGGISR